MLIDFQREREREGEREGEKHASVQQPQNLGMCPDLELNPQPFSLWDDALTEPHWPGLFLMMVIQIQGSSFPPSFFLSSPGPFSSIPCLPPVP